MSWLKCDRCGDLVNSDNDPDSGYVEIPNYTNLAQPVNPAYREKQFYDCICGSCREVMIEDMEREAHHER